MLYQDAVLRFAQKDYAGARRSLEDTLKQNVDNGLALNLLAQTYSVQGDKAKALSVVQQYAAQKPTSPYLGTLAGMWDLRRPTYRKRAKGFSMLFREITITTQLGWRWLMSIWLWATWTRFRRLKMPWARSLSNHDALWRMAAIELKPGINLPHETTLQL